ncbi:putative disease resistance protein RGA3 [Bidens hawaiensis]|uniref:putative disease resistance protein RGA3 n=1 Tax=Bidens hawaiensis TaxID=980011 RepID=UPI00404A313A
MDHFELKAWVCVSDEFDSFHISKEIFEAMEKVNKEFTKFNLLHEALRDQVRGKRFILLLEDVWTESNVDWNTLVVSLHVSAPGSKVILTTRNDQFLNQLVYNSLNKQLHSLLDDDALSLVAQHALGVYNFDSHLPLKGYVECIVKKCDGLPLALIALGRLLRTKKDEVEHWEKVQKVRYEN